MVTTDEFTALAIDIFGGDVSRLSPDGLLLNVPLGREGTQGGNAQLPLRELFNQYGSKSVEEIRAVLIEVFQSVSGDLEDPQHAVKQPPFSLMVKSDAYWANAMAEAQRMDTLARPVCRSYLHGFSVGLVQSIAHPQSQQLVRRMVLNSMLKTAAVEEDAAFKAAFDSLDANTPSQLAVGDDSGLQYKVTLVDTDGGLLYMIFFKDNLTAARMVLPRFATALSALLGCTSRELLVVPYTECTLFVGLCSQPLSAYLLGVHTLAEARQPGATPNMLTSTPYMIAKCPDNNATPGSDATPGSAQFVEWKKYPAFGSPHGFVTTDGTIQNPVPSSAAMAELQSEQLNGNAVPAPLLEGKTRDTCYCCGKYDAASKHMACSRCKVARYCSKDCQKQDHKEHKAFCINMADAT